MVCTLFARLEEDSKGQLEKMRREIQKKNVLEGRKHLRRMHVRQLRGLAVKVGHFGSMDMNTLVAIVDHIIDNLLLLLSLYP